MPIPPALSRPLRRVVAAVLALSVFLTMLGGAHPACDEPAGLSDAAGMVTSSHAGANGVHDAGHARAHGPGEAPGRALAADPGAGPDGCPDHDRHHGAGAEGCALVAHCAAAVIPTGSGLAVPTLMALAGLAVPDAGRPLDRPHQPESPPPKA